MQCAIGEARERHGPLVLGSKVHTSGGLINAQGKWCSDDKNKVSGWCLCQETSGGVA